MNQTFSEPVKTYVSERLRSFIYTLNWEFRGNQSPFTNISVYDSSYIYQSNWGRFLEVAFNGKRSTFPLENVEGEEVVFLPLSDDIGLKFFYRIFNGFAPEYLNFGIKFRY